MKALLLTVVLLGIFSGCGEDTRAATPDLVGSGKSYELKNIYPAMLSYYGAARNASGLLSVRWGFGAPTVVNSKAFTFHVEYWVRNDGSMRLKFQQTIGELLDVSIEKDGNVLAYIPRDNVYFRATLRDLFEIPEGRPELIVYEALLGPWPVPDSKKKAEVTEKDGVVGIYYFDRAVGLDAICRVRRDLPIIIDKTWKKDGAIFAKAVYEGERKFSNDLVRPKKVTWTLAGTADESLTVAPKIFSPEIELTDKDFSVHLPNSAREVEAKAVIDQVFKSIKSQ